VHRYGRGVSGWKSLRVTRRCSANQRRGRIFFINMKLLDVNVTTDGEPKGRAEVPSSIQPRYLGLLLDGKGGYPFIEDA